MSNPDNNLQNLRHSTAHLLAAAVMELYPGVKRAIGPAIETGFYYDFDFGDKKISDEDLPKIEEKMRELVKTWDGFEREEITIGKARELFKSEPYKLELAEEFNQQGLPLTTYSSGVIPANAGIQKQESHGSRIKSGMTYIDLCKGGHTVHPKSNIKHFKLLSLAGAYWRGDEKNKMLTRIYGTAFPTKQALEEHLTMLEEARKRDHRKLGQELDLFVFSELVGKGLPLFTPRGTMLRELLNDFSQKLRTDRGFQKVWIPHITKNDLYKVSGHWDKFGNELFLVTSQETSDQMVMKPMNCPHHQQIYASKPRSYKDLPIKYLETTTIYRDEKAGELNGLSRVRSATQDDSHTFCTPDQIESVYQELIDVVKTFYSALGMKFRARLSFRDPNSPEKYLGEPALWEKAQNIIRDIAIKNDLDYYEVKGEAAFYGPKIDFMVTDALGREWQTATPQLDFVQPKRFGITYTDSDGTAQTPVMIHFALMGSIERFLSVYIEHTAGAFPLWLAPTQVELLPIADRHIEFGEKVYNQLNQSSIRVNLNIAKATLQSKIREATLQKVPFMGIIGDREVTAESVALRTREGKDLGQVSISSFLQQLKEDIDKKA